MSKNPGTRFFQKKTTAASPTPLGNGGVLNTGPGGGGGGGGGGVQILLNDGGVIFARRGKSDADLKTHTGNVYKYRKRIQIPETYTNTENVYKYRINSFKVCSSTGE